MILLSSNQPQRLLLALALTFLGFTASTALYADSHEGATNHEHHQKNKDAGGMDKNEDMEKHQRMAEELNLTDEQRKLFRGAMKTMMDNMQDGKELHEQLRDLTQSDNYNEEKVRELIHKHNAGMENNMIESSKAMHNFYASLSTEQKTKLKDMHKDMKKNMKEHMRKHMGGKMDKTCDENDSSPSM